MKHCSIQNLLLSPVKKKKKKNRRNMNFFKLKNYDKQALLKIHP